MKLSTQTYNKIIHAKKAASDLATAQYVRRRLKRSGCICVPPVEEFMKAPISTHPYFVQQRQYNRVKLLFTR